MSERRALPVVEYRDFSRRVHERASLEHRVIKAQLELTYRCNLHCRHCYTDPYNASEFFPRELTLGETTRLLDDLADLGVIWLNLSGGEIFQHPRFWDIYRHAHRAGFLLQLYTNGTLFTRSVIERLQQHPPFTIDVSCHTVDEARFDWFTQVPGSFRSFLRGLDLLRTSGLSFNFRTKAMNWNRRELPDIRRFVESFDQRFGCTTTLSPRLNGDCSSLDYRLAPEEIVALRETDAAGDELPCQATTALSPPSTDRLYRCGCGTDTIHISAWGELGTCTMQYEQRISLRQVPLREAVSQLFSKIQSMRYDPSSACYGCSVHAFCDKTPTDARRERGSPQEPIPYACDVAVARAEQAGAAPVRHPLTPRTTGTT
jgi:MoaA/NifB/PqqE/SkfB family radical SAM enzyme